MLNRIYHATVSENTRERLYHDRQRLKLAIRNKLLFESQFPSLVASHRQFLASQYPVLVYAPPKTGTSTVDTTLKTHLMDQPVFHRHRLSENHLNKLKADILQKHNKRYEAWRNYTLKHTTYMRGLVCHYPEKRWKIVTLVRDPISRSLSLFFFVQDSYSTVEKPQSELEALFFQGSPYLASDSWHPEAQDEWFEEEMLGVMGVDVFSTPFPKQQGYKIYQGENVDILLIKLEYLNSCYREALSEYLGLEITDLENKKVVSSRDSIGEKYQAFKDNLILGSDYIDRAYQTRVAQHFYSDEDIAKFRSKWT